MLWLGMKLPSKVLKNYGLIKQLCSTNQSEFKTVYKFPYIRGVGIINRLKLYQTVLTALAVPSTVILNLFDILTLEHVTLTTFAGATTMAPLYAMGFFAHKLIGIVYLNEKDDLVKLSYIDFWGNRKDVEVPIKEIVPFSESSASVTDILYLKVRQFSSKDTMKLCVRYGILDDKGFNKIFAD